ncbi:MAG: MFS transporter [Chloroflexi bacterium]|nr:MAG: MFS transporter [Chloroflexota bacterium]MBL1195695.1 MFS transporter [Chloroflexota bacterium]NOH12983.1 MFS transporter [Chloroflexota bacterium]
MTSERVIRNYLTIAALYTLSASLIWGVNTLFLLDAGLNIFGVFIANSVFTGAMALFEIPTGVLADTRGRRASFLLSLVVLAIGTLGYVAAGEWGGGLLWFSLTSIILGLGYTFYSGAVEAWLVDALNASGYSGNLDRIFARAGIVTGGAMLVGTVGGGFLGNLDLAIPFLARAVLLLILFVLAYFTMHDIGYEPRALEWSRIPAEMSKIARVSLRFGWKEPQLRLLMLNGAVTGSFFFWAFYAWQPYFLELLGEDAVWVAGVVAALIAISTMAGNAFVEWFSGLCGRRTTVLLWATFIISVAMVLVGVTGNFWVAVVVFLIAMAASGVYTPVRQAYIHQLIPSEERATMISFDSMVASAGSIFGQSGLGYLAQQVQSIGTGYITGGLYTLVALPILYALRRMDDPADAMIGPAGADSGCAAQGIPQVSGVDTVAKQLPVAGD